ncbi:calcitonin gene-related peptide 1-like [Saccopteryx leptura]|uniref:calcitonin gene-related peptide 1-like n=1 Tax=Saccopteryx leptura TaxID=249018 RepID=UPI00339C98F0
MLESPRYRAQRKTQEKLSGDSALTDLVSCQPDTRKSGGIMGFWKFTPILALGILVLYQAGMLQAEPFKSDPESTPQPTPHREEEDLLLALLMREFMKKMASEKQRMAEGSSGTPQKRACNTGTCLTHKLAGLLSRSGSVAHTNMLPPDMVAKNSARKGRDLDA